VRKSDSGGVFFLVSFSFPVQVVFNQSQGQGWERGSGPGGVAVDPGGRGGTQGVFPQLGW